MVAGRRTTIKTMTKSTEGATKEFKWKNIFVYLRFAHIQMKTEIAAEKRKYKYV